MMTVIVFSFLHPSNLLSPWLRELIKILHELFMKSLASLNRIHIQSFDTSSFWLTCCSFHRINFELKVRNRLRLIRVTFINSATFYLSFTEIVVNILIKFIILLLLLFVVVLILFMLNRANIYLGNGNPFSCSLSAYSITLLRLCRGEWFLWLRRWLHIIHTSVSYLQFWYLFSVLIVALIIVSSIKTGVLFLVSALSSLIYLLKLHQISSKLTIHLMIRKLLNCSSIFQSIVMMMLWVMWFIQLSSCEWMIT